MERVLKVEDISPAVRHLAVKGILPRTKIREVEAFLTQKVSHPEVRDWYSGKGRVINERPILSGGKSVKRPDRIIIMPDGGAIVIDYKFGKSEKTYRRYSRQVKRYVDRLKATGRYRSVKGYIWYVKEDKVLEVC